VQLAYGTLESLPDSRILNGASGALIGDEVVQFATAELIGASLYRLSRLLRGRLGTDARDKAVVEMWQRRMELGLLSNTAGCFRNTHPFFKGRIPQVPEYGAVCKEAAVKQLQWLDGELANRRFIAGDRYTIADITALVGVDFGRVSDIRILPEQKNLARWHQEVSSRPSAKA